MRWLLLTLACAGVAADMLGFGVYVFAVLAFAVLTLVTLLAWPLSHRQRERARARHRQRLLARAGYRTAPQVPRPAAGRAAQPTDCRYPGAPAEQQPAAGATSPASTAGCRFPSAPPRSAPVSTFPGDEIYTRPGPRIEALPTDDEPEVIEHV